MEPLGDGLGTLFVRALDRLLHAEPPAREVVPDGAHWQRDAVLPLEQRTEGGARASTPPAWEPSHRIDTVLWWAPRAAPISVTGRPFLAHRHRDPPFLRVGGGLEGARIGMTV